MLKVDIKEFILKEKIILFSILKKIFSPPSTFMKSYFISNSKDLRETSFALLFTTFGNLLTGYFMAVYSSKLAVIPALLILIPGAIAMRGNIFGAFGSRLGSYLHLGQIEPYFKKTTILSQNIISSFSLSFFMSLFLAGMAGIAANVLHIPYNFIDLAVISLLAGVISGVFMLFPTILIAFLSFRRGWNPDNLEAPLITLFGDILTLPFLFLSANFVLKITPVLRYVFFTAFILLSVIFLLLGLRTKPYSREIVMESLPVFLFCGVLSAISGSILSTKVEGLVQIAGIFTLIPAFLENGGALGGILSANFSSWLHLGVVDPTILPSKKVGIKFLNTHLVGLVPFSLLGILVYGVNSLLAIPTPSLETLFWLTVVAGESLILMVNLLTHFLSVVTHRAQLNPDNVVIPLITSFMDVLGSFSLMLFLVLFGVI